VEVYAVPSDAYDGRLRRSAIILVGVALLILIAGCGDPAPKTDAELGLNLQQANGRQIFEHNCAVCHNAYSSSGSKGPSLKRLFRKQYLPSGLPANDRFVEQTIVVGRGMMAGLGDSITYQQLDDLIAYLHTL
jgi:mono/diheme cytochrome c family protein